MVLTEGKTDPIYLRAAIRNLSNDYQQLGAFDGGKVSFKVKFLKYSNMTKKVLDLKGGEGNLNKLIQSYEKDLKNFQFKPLRHPVIILIDNDDGAKSIIRIVKSKFGIGISNETIKPFYHLCHNLYLVKTPEGDNLNKPMSDIEDLFDAKWLEKEIDGKSFNRSNKSSGESEYGKQVFATEVILPNVDRMDFSRFTKLLDRLVEVLDHYQAP